MKMLNDWLQDRRDQSLHPYQLTCIQNIVKVTARPAAHKRTRRRLACSVAVGGVDG